MASIPSREHVQRLVDAREWSVARPLLESLHAASPAEQALLHVLCEAEINDGAALRALERLAGRGDDLEAAFLHARAQAAIGRHDLARDELRALRARLPGVSANVELHLAAAE